MSQDDLFSFTEFKETSVETEHVILAVCNYFGTNLQQMKERRRLGAANKIALAKKCLMYILREHVQLSFPKIADRLGYADHTSVMHHVEDFRKRLANDKNMHAAYSSILYSIPGIKNHTHRISTFLSSAHGATMSKDLVRKLCEVDSFVQGQGYRLALVKLEKGKE